MRSISKILLHPDKVIRYLNRKCLEAYIAAITPDDAVRSIRSGPLKGKKWIYGSGCLNFFLGTYESEIADTFIKYAKKSNVIYDLGAHVGYYTLLASKYVSHQGEVCAFEPLPRNIFYLRKHMELNKISNVRIFDSAISDINGIVEFREVDDDQAGTLCSDSIMSHKVGSIKTNSISLDEFLFRNENNRPPQLVKMDVEGAEYGALKGGEKLLDEYHPTIFLSTHNCHSKGIHRRCSDFLENLGYEISYFDLHKRITEMDDPWYEVLAEYRLSDQPKR
ncbi:Methyltransferase FkbM domain protein [uncultured archaeon]|nr:Methyltransferase FkbM domain protein [uncultured archaeon]